ncbi:DUF5329 family protein [Zooshikella marina]|uniref:DUF5329 family protein n=1 Tax=Zooshikella ganghwensis TaxID=202772 RepID=UPI0013FD8678|nr:DUF5329 family protein [Zooshikella ganghwensis]MBU2708675.1 DUF5329 family protein [Zooshikella ganghwensis]
MKYSITIALAVLLVSTKGIADISPTTKNEIAHLLEFVQNTTCKYERNGEMHAGSEAVEHIQKKYDYFQDKVKSTEDFIRYSATKSELSGKHYRIHCKGEAVQNSSSWLLKELNAYRQSTH